MASSASSSSHLTANANASDIRARGRLTLDNPKQTNSTTVGEKEQRHSRRGRDDGIALLLQAYESDESSSSDVRETSEVGGASRGIQIVFSDEDTRTRREGQKSEFGVRENLGPEKESRTPSYDQRPASENLASRLATGAECESEEQSLNVSSCEDMPDLESRLAVVSIARVASALCAARVRGMAYSSLDASELGEIFDAIPPAHTQTRMAAQLALSERALLQSWAAAWSELEHAALRHLDSRVSAPRCPS
ncbi:hypothetical protein EW145_g8107 [Phellinidium pouzarii]|uniref:Uncharacterized protein n=1 Tax=Phellinidium pouzarii TaxID=167371 RepID=A0A4S4K9K7_9AGAM|nr:hypothetical protein EW145_g8107 [Phellinidium pouzarii]